MGFVCLGDLVTINTNSLIVKTKIHYLVLFCLVFAFQNIYSQFTVTLAAEGRTVTGNTVTICQGESVQINAEVTDNRAGANHLYFWSVPELNLFEYRGDNVVGNILILNNDRLPTRDLQVNLRVEERMLGGTQNSSINVSVQTGPNAGNTRTLLLCGLSGTINLFDYLGGSADNNGSWTGPDGTAFGTGNTANFVVNTDQVGEYRYTVPGNGVCPGTDASLNVKDCFDNDFDNDGVANDDDLDDDNDGILDAEENSFCTAATLTESSPVFDNNFGTGTTTSQDEFVVNHTFSPTFPQDGAYTVGNSLAMFNVNNAGNFFVATDANPIPHSDGGGNTNGRYLAINVMDGLMGQPIYELTNIPIIANQEYNFRIDLAGLCDLAGAQCSSIPNLELRLIDDSNTILESRTSVGLGVLNDDIWRTLRIDNFTAATTSLITLQIITNEPNGASSRGNDLGIDNIRFAPLECDFDRDLVPNYLDLDSDNDGIFDFIEAGGDPAWDTNGDGMIDEGGIDLTNGIPLLAGSGLTPRNTDLDSTSNFDYLDIDSDNDGIPDALEAQSTDGYVPPSGNDSNANGVDDVYEGSGAIIPVDTDGDDTPDYRDLNSDDDCLDDTTEAYDTDQDGDWTDQITGTFGTDTDNDGLDDIFDIVVLDEPASVTNPTDGGELVVDFPNNHNPGDDVDYREEFRLVDVEESIEGCTSSTAPFDLFDELVGTDAEIPGGTWTGPSTLTNGERGTFTPGTNTVGTYVYTLPVIGSCPARTGTVVVNLGTEPDAGTDGSVSVCRSDSTIELFDSLGGSPDTGGTWTDADANPLGSTDRGAFDPTTDAAGTYTYTVGVAGCQETATVTVTINAGANPGLDNAITVCNADGTINLIDFLGGSPDSGGTWSGLSPLTNGDQGTIDLSEADPGAYTYTVTTADCPDASATVTVTIETQPVISLYSSLCSADRASYDIYLMSNGSWDLSISPDIDGVTIGDDEIIGIPAETTITITATNASASGDCMESTLVVTAPNCNCPDITDPINDTSVVNQNRCFGDTPGELSVITEAGLTANWYDQNNIMVASETNTYTPTVTEPGAYTYLVEAFNISENCASNRIPVSYSILDIPQVDAEVVGQLCIDKDGQVIIGESQPLISVPLSTTDYTFQWYFEDELLASETNSSILGDRVGQYMVEYTDFISGCSKSAFATLDAVQGIGEGDLSLRLSRGQFGDENSIIATVDGDGEYLYSLDGGEFQEDNVFSNVPYGLRTVTVIDQQGCGQAEAFIKVFGFPPFFTPNGDAINDTWNVKIRGDQEIPPMDIYIFDRYGRLLKRQSPDDLGWDGTYNGVPLPSTDYWYSAQLIDGTAEYKGHFHLKR